MAAWPELDELKLALSVENDDWDDTLERVLAAAITKVKQDVAIWDEDVDEPDDSLAQAALRMGELLSERPDAIPGTKAWQSLSSDLTYATLLAGHRRAFGIS